MVFMDLLKANEWPANQPNKWFKILMSDKNLESFIEWAKNNLDAKGVDLTYRQMLQFANDGKAALFIIRNIPQGGDIVRKEIKRRYGEFKAALKPLLQEKIGSKHEGKRNKINIELDSAISESVKNLRAGRGINVDWEELDSKLNFDNRRLKRIKNTLDDTTVEALTNAIVNMDKESEKGKSIIDDLPNLVKLLGIKKGQIVKKEKWEPQTIDSEKALIFLLEIQQKNRTHTTMERAKGTPKQGKPLIGIHLKRGDVGGRVSLPALKSLYRSTKNSKIINKFVVELFKLGETFESSSLLSDLEESVRQRYSLSEDNKIGYFVRNQFDNYKAMKDREVFLEIDEDVDVNEKTLKDLFNEQYGNPEYPQLAEAYEEYRKRLDNAFRGLPQEFGHFVKELNTQIRAESGELYNGFNLIYGNELEEYKQNMPENNSLSIAGGFPSTKENRNVPIYNLPSDTTTYGKIVNEIWQLIDGLIKDEWKDKEGELKDEYKTLKRNYRRFKKSNPTMTKDYHLGLLYASKVETKEHADITGQFPKKIGKILVRLAIDNFLKEGSVFSDMTEIPSERLTSAQADFIEIVRVINKLSQVVGSDKLNNALENMQDTIDTEKQKYSKLSERRKHLKGNPDMFNQDIKQLNFILEESISNAKDGLTRIIEEKIKKLTENSILTKQKSWAGIFYYLEEKGLVKEVEK